MTFIRWVLNMLKNIFFFFFYILAMNKPTIRPDTMMNDYLDPRLDYVTDYEQDQDVPESIVSRDWLADLHERMIR
jgi:hypothetical protein